MTGGFNCLKNFSKLFTSNYMSYLIKKLSLMSQVLNFADYIFCIIFHFAKLLKLSKYLKKTF
jgi:hypothetical protein